MDLNRQDAEALLGAWALDALDPAERSAVERAIEADPYLREEAAHLRSGLSGLARATGTDVPRDLLESILAATRSMPRSTWPVSTPAEAFANQVERLRTLAVTLTDADWGQVAHPYDWTVHGLIAHLLVIERYTAALLGLDGAVPTDAASHLGAGSDAIAHEQSRDPASTWRDWTDVADRIVDATAALNDAGDRTPIDFHGWHFTVDRLLIARAFEIWTHADDIRRATGRPQIAPAPEDLRAMSTLSVTSLPALVSFTVPERVEVAVRVVLTGDGGGVFDLGEPARRTALMVADVVDYCRLAARRVSPDEFEHHIEGDRRLVSGLLDAAQAFAV